MRKLVAVAVLVSSAVLVFSSTANAGWYHWAIRGYGAGFYSPCFVPGCNSGPGCWACNPYATRYVAHRPCVFHHHWGAAHRAAACGSGWRSYFSSGGCGIDSCGWNSCGGDSCGTGSCGMGSCGGGMCGGSYCGDGSCGMGSCGMGSCGMSSCGMSGGCDGGCSGGCGYGGGCSGCNGGGVPSQGSGENIIYDGPAADAPPAAAPAPAPDSAAQNGRGVPYRLVSSTKRDGSASFDKGLTSLRAHSLNDALGAFDSALSAEPNNAMYCYHRALVIYEMNGADAANETLQRAVELEKSEPVANWGKRMERVQGRSRVWIESARRSAGIGR